MAEARVQGHDFKVFFRRLVVPGELGRDSNSLFSPSQLAGFPSAANQDQTKSPNVNSLITAANTSKSDTEFRANVQKLIDTLFENYSPKDFRDRVKAKAVKVAADFRATIVAKTQALADTNTAISAIDQTLQAISLPPGFVGPVNPSNAGGLRQTLSPGVSNTLAQESAFFFRTQNDPVTYSQAKAANISGSTVPGTNIPNTPGSLPGVSTIGDPPIVRDRSHFYQTKALVDQNLATLPDLIAIEKNWVKSLNSDLDLLIGGDLLPEDEKTLRVRVSATIDSILSFRAPSTGNKAQISQLNTLRSQQLQRAQDLQADLSVLNASSPLRPFYEPILLDCLLGPYKVDTSLNRLGQPGTASVAFHLPLASNSLTPDLFMGFNSEDVFSLSTLEQAGRSIPSSTLGILKSNLRETTIQPFDMIQIWGRKKLSTGSTFPGDYAPVFTGFVTKTSVSYVGSTIGVTVQAEDVGKVLRLARVNVDPALDPSFRAAGINVTPFQNVLQSAQFKTGADLIKGLLKGSPGTILGLSQVEVLSKVEVQASGTQTIPKFTTTSNVVSLASDFENIKLNLFEDLLTRWAPYASQFKNAFRLWETDARTKFDICREVADVTEFEFYVDGLGVVNYHPPLYFLNPFAPQYLIEDIDIESESHNVDEAEVLTVVEVHSQPSFIPDTIAYNALRRNDSLIQASDALIQRYGVRWQKKSVPILSGLDSVAATKTGNQKLLTDKARNTARDGYARAWMNRRNARLRSATVTINGTPEIRVCNTVAFVGNLQQTMRNVAQNQLSISDVTGLGTVAATAANIVNKGAVLSPAASIGAVAALKNILVYYVSAVTHNYTQGGRYTTTLTLTHGRPWTEPLNQGSVGYALDAKDSDSVVEQMKAAFGQSLTGADADAFLREVNNKLQYIASGNTSYLTPQDASQFGFTANKPKTNLLTKARLFLASEINGAIEKLQTAYCTVLSKKNEPDQVEKKAKDKSKAKSKSFSDYLNQIGTAITKGIDSAETAIAKALSKLGIELNKAEAEAKKKLLAEGQKAISDLQEKAFNAVMGGKTIKTLLDIPLTANATLPDSARQALQVAGADVSKITSFPFGAVIYVYISRSDTSFEDAQNKAQAFLRAQAASVLNPANTGQMKLVVNDSIDSTRISKVNIDSKIPPTYVYFYTGFMVWTVSPNC